MLGSCVQAQPDISNSIRVLGLLMGEIPSWASHLMAFPSVSVLILPLHFLHRKNSMSKFLKVAGGSIPPLRAVAEGGLLWSHLTIIEHFCKGHPHWVLGASHIPGIWYYLEVPPNSCSCIFPFILLTHWASLLSSPILDSSPISALHPPTSFPPSFYLLLLFCSSL